MELYEHARQVFALTPGGALQHRDGTEPERVSIHGRGDATLWLDTLYFVSDIARLMTAGRNDIWSIGELPTARRELEEDVNAASEAQRCWAWHTEAGLIWQDRRYGWTVEGDPIMAFIPQEVIRGTRGSKWTKRRFLKCDVLHLLEHGRWPWTNPEYDEPICEPALYDFDFLD